MNELLDWSLGSLIWGFILSVSGSFTKNILENKLIKSSRIGFFLQIIGVIFMFVAIIGISAFIITGFAKTISILI